MRIRAPSSLLSTVTLFMALKASAAPDVDCALDRSKVDDALDALHAQDLDDEVQRSRARALETYAGVFLGLSARRVLTSSTVAVDAEAVFMPDDFEDEAPCPIVQARRALSGGGRRGVPKGRADAGGVAIELGPVEGSGRYQGVGVLFETKAGLQGACTTVSQRARSRRLRKIYGRPRRLRDVDGDGRVELELWTSLGAFEAPSAYLPFWYDVTAGGLRPVPISYTAARYLRLEKGYRRAGRTHVARAIRDYLQCAEAGGS